MSNNPTQRWPYTYPVAFQGWKTSLINFASLLNYSVNYSAILFFSWWLTSQTPLPFIFKYLCRMSEEFKSSLAQQTTTENTCTLVFISLCVLSGIWLFSLWYHQCVFVRFRTQGTAFFHGFIIHVRPSVEFNCKCQSEETHFVAIVIRQNGRGFNSALSRKPTEQNMRVGTAISHFLAGITHHFRFFPALSSFSLSSPWREL